MFKSYPMPLLRGHHKDIPLTQRTKFIGRRKSFQGYIYIYKPDHPFASKSKTTPGYIREHRVVWEEANGRLLGPKEVVHHINGIKDDNRPENLIALSNADHRRLHASETQQFLSASAQTTWDDGRMVHRDPSVGR
jgi:hypothetical protein